ncbi:DMT family transporter [Priestia megaterium]|uniref:DMT family transporter n=1 Tax=Priestia megaterium TaxID=1404 RepID=UPI0012D9B716|nr:DMT family transporter [Priestia megaterium]MUL34291.1 S-adenosylmethionine/S-adenosylhomocysteine transporter [Priestia megaterium]
MKQTIVAYIKISLAMAIVGSSVVAGKLILSSFPIFLASEFRFIIATLILIPLLLWREKRIAAIKPKVLLILFLQALTGVFLFNIFMLYGLKFTTAIEAGVITSTLPAIIGIISFVFLKERLTPKKIIGIILAVIGVLLMNVISGGSSSINSLLGNSLIIGAVLTEALFITLGKSVSSKVSPLTISTMMSIFGLILFLPFALYEAKNFTFSTVDIIDWLNILYFGVVITVIAFLLMYQGLSKVSASSAGILTSILPLSTVILSFLVLKEKILLSHIVGMAFVLVAIFVLSKESTKEETDSQTAISP